MTYKYVYIITSLCIGNTCTAFVSENEVALNQILHTLHHRSHSHSRIPLIGSYPSHDSAWRSQADLNLIPGLSTAVKDALQNYKKFDSSSSSSSEVFGIKNAASSPLVPSGVTSSVSKRWGDTLSSCIFAHCMPDGRIRLECVVSLCQRFGSATPADAKRKKSSLALIKNFIHSR